MTDSISAYHQIKTERNKTVELLVAAILCIAFSAVVCTAFGWALITHLKAQATIPSTPLLADPIMIIVSGGGLVGAIVGVILVVVRTIEIKRLNKKLRESKEAS